MLFLLACVAVLALAAILPALMLSSRLSRGEEAFYLKVCCSCGADLGVAPAAPGQGGQLSHGLCDECAARLYPEYFPEDELP